MFLNYLPTYLIFFFFYQRERKSKTRKRKPTDSYIVIKILLTEFYLKEKHTDSHLVIKTLLTELFKGKTLVTLKAKMRKIPRSN